MSATENYVWDGGVLSFVADQTVSTANQIVGGDFVKIDVTTGLIVIATSAAHSASYVGVADSNQVQIQMGGTYALEKTPVKTRGVVEMSIASGTYFAGDLVKIAGRTTVALCTTNENRIGVIVENTAASATKVKIKLLDGIDSTVNMVG